MASHQAYVQEELGGPVSLKTVETPTPTAGQVLVSILATPLLSYTKHVLDGSLFPLVHPFVPGISAIGRVAATGPDSTSLSVGQLVFCTPVIRARDDPTGGTIILHGWFGGLSPEARKLMEGPWRDGAWAEKMLAPTENVVALDEQRLLSNTQLGYKLEQLMWINEYLVPYGGWLAADLKPGQVAIVAPGTGHFGSCAVQVALTMGAKKVVAAGRNEKNLKQVEGLDKQGRIEGVQLTGDVAADTESLRKATGAAGADVYLDFSPPQAGGTTHPNACVAALKQGGCAVLMGGITSDVSLNYASLMIRNITVRGNFMYPPTAPMGLVSLIESGQLDLGAVRTDAFSFEKLHEGIDAAEAAGGIGELIVLSLPDKM